VNDGKPRASWMYRLAPKKLTLALFLAKVMPEIGNIIFQYVIDKPSDALSVTLRVFPAARRKLSKTGQTGG
jgi:hypothetical protein